MPPTPAPAPTRKYWPWVAGVVVITALVLAVWVLMASTPLPPPAPTPSLPEAGTQGPGTSQGGQGLSIPINGGSSISTRDFLSDTQTISDPNNPGYYYLGYHQSTGPEDASATDAPPYVIGYIVQTHYFNVGLYAEPIGQVRIEAEQYLLNMLGITEEEACTLKYMVSVPNNVNSYYSGQNLGFSFCPGAVKLPQ